MFTTLAYSLLAGSALAAPHGNGHNNGLAVRGSHQVAKRSYSGKTTWYGPEESDPRFACYKLPSPWNYYSSGSQMIVALAPGVFNNGAHCGDWITVSANGKTVSARVVDECASCTYDAWIDLSPGAISVLDSNYKVTGEFDVTWWFSSGSDDSAQETTTTTTTTTTKEQPTSTYTPPPPETSTYTPPPETSTYTPPPPTSSSTYVEPSSSSAIVESSSTSIVPSSSLIPSASISASITSSFNGSSLLPSASLSVVNGSLVVNGSTFASATPTSSQTYTSLATVSLKAGPSATASAIHPDAIITVTAEEATGNLAVLNNLITTIGRIIIAGANA